MARGIIHSGGADGADKLFGDIGTDLGFKVYHHSFKDHKILGKGIRVEHTDEELYKANKYLYEANKILGRRFPASSNFVNNLLRRNYYQVKDSDSIIAIASLENETKVKGGTGWAVAMAVFMDKDVFVFDDGQTNLWYQYMFSLDQFISIDHKPYIKNQIIAGIGTRDISEAGKNAIIEVLNA